MTRVANRDAGPLIRERAPFLGSNMRGVRNGPYSRGWLSPAWWQRLLDEQPEYVVYSYDTPIAWTSTNEEWVGPDLPRYTRTTNRHLSVVRAALSG